MSLPRVVFGASGRLGRGMFFLRVVLVLALFAAANALLEPLLGAATVWLVNPLALWALLAAMVRRLHDRAYSGHWLWLGLVPIIGAAWLFWQCCRKSAVGTGDASPDAAGGRDFLVVQ